MASLDILRSRPLGPAERARLPEGVTCLGGEGERVAHILAPEDPAALVALVLALARALPDCRVLWVETALEPAAQSVPPPGAPPPPRPAGAAAGDPWKLVESGEVEAGLRLLSGTDLDGRGRDYVRSMLQDTDPARLALACRIARVTGWRSSVSNIRRLLDHGDKRVRLAAIEAVGALAGPGLVPALLRLSGDPNPEIQAAAAAAVQTIEGEPA